MSKPESNQPYYETPVTRETFQGFIDIIEENLSISRSVTFNFYPQIGGASSWINAITNKNSELNIISFLKSRSFIYYKLNPKDIFDKNTENFISYIHSIIVTKNNSMDTTTHHKLLEIKDKLKSEISKNKSILIIIPKMNLFNFDTEKQYNILYSLYEIDKHKVNFLSTMETYNPKEFFNQIGLLKTPLKMYFHEYTKFSEKDIRYSIQHWGKIFSVSYTQKEIKTVIKLSNGSLYYTKILCNLVSQDKTLINNEDKLTEILV